MIEKKQLLSHWLIERNGKNLKSLLPHIKNYFSYWLIYKLCIYPYRYIDFLMNFQDGCILPGHVQNVFNTGRFSDDET